jgi:tRNA modification GTPase
VTGQPIAAIATAPGRGAVGIVRVSGPALADLARALLGRVPAPRHAHYGAFLGARGEVLDQGVALYFPAPHSFTGEDVLELQAHGGPVLLRLLLARCLEAGASLGWPIRLARPGEFAERAFLNGKMDLAQAEAMADLIDASTEAAARSAARSLSGAFSRDVQELAEGLLDLRLRLEAELDFPDEEDVSQLALSKLKLLVGDLQRKLADLTLRARQGKLLREGLRVVIAGRPNAGKSSLLNALAGAERAIVTDVAGTTRDLLHEHIAIEGVPLHVTDTAGLRDSGDPVERIGIERAWQAIGEADVLLLLHDLTRQGDAARQAEDAELAASVSARLPARAVVIDLWNKADLAPLAGVTGERTGIALSAKTGSGLADLRRALLEAAGWQALPEGVYAARERHLDALRRAGAHLEGAATWLAAFPAPLELVAEDLRLAHDACGEITGRVTADDLLGAIFSRFCIGK